ncbi:MAG TPA: PRC-barrel domain-containing protein [Gemmatimonadaceae bacterium]
MIRATELAGRAVVDIDAAEKLGTIDKIILDPDARRVAGFVVAKAGSGFPGSKAHMLIGAGAVHAIGPDAVTIRQSAVAGSDTAHLETLPRGSDVIGRKVVSEDGRFLGKVSDVLIDRTDGRIVGYLLAEHTPGAKFEEMFGKDKKKRRDSPYLPADAKIRTGRDLLVASEDAVSYDWADEDPARVAGTPMHLWGYTPPPSPIEPPVRTDVEPAVVREMEPAVTVDAVHPHARELPNDIDGIDTSRETNPRVR